VNVMRACRLLFLDGMVVGVGRMCAAAIDGIWSFQSNQVSDMGELKDVNCMFTCE
jgi:hypothetical protein